MTASIDLTITLSIQVLPQCYEQFKGSCELDTSQTAVELGHQILFGPIQLTHIHFLKTTPL